MYFFKDLNEVIVELEKQIQLFYKVGELIW